jgi:hypothetical protein
MRTDIRIEAKLTTSKDITHYFLLKDGQPRLPGQTRQQSEGMPNSKNNDPHYNQ